MTTVRKQKSGDQLTVGDWLAPGELADRAAEVLYAHAYPASGDRSRDNDGTHVALMTRELGKVAPLGVTIAGAHLFDLASDEDLAGYREAAERAQKIADIRAFADWLEANPRCPLPDSVGGQTSIGRGGDIWNSGANGVAEVRRIAVLMGAETVQDDERIKVVKTFGDVAHTVVAWHRDGRPAEPAPEPKRGTTCEELSDADPTGQLYSRADEADDPTPVSGGRIEPHTGAVTDSSLVPKPIAEHYDASEFAGDAVCACGESFGGLGALDRLDQHVAKANAVTDGGLVDETEEPERHEVGGGEVGPTGLGDCSAWCACGVKTGGWDTVAQAQEQIDLHIEAATSPTGLTKAADESRGPLAGMTPVVTYFSFGYGQKDPDTFKPLIDHYVTAVAPTFEQCREAMFASRFGDRWSFDYLAGTARATEAIREWTEHEVIVAPGVDQAAADRALAAALRVLLDAV